MRQQESYLKVKKYLLLLIVGVMAGNMAINAQNSTKFTMRFSKDDSPKTYPLNVAYYGIMTFHPGIKLGVDYPILRLVNKRQNGFLHDIGLMRKQSTVRWQLWLSGNIMTYHHKKNHVGLLLIPELTARRISHSGWYADISLGTGYARYFLPTTYQVSNNNTVEQVNNAGRTYVALTFAPAFGLDRSIKKANAARWYMKPNLLLLMPYNQAITLNYAFEFGVGIRLNKSKKTINK
jgi:hypothetical protein